MNLLQLSNILIKKFRSPRSISMLDPILIHLSKLETHILLSKISEKFNTQFQFSQELILLFYEYCLSNSVSQEYLLYLMINLLHNYNQSKKLPIKPFYLQFFQQKLQTTQLKLLPCISISVGLVKVPAPKN
ncbi:unnamed protein product (macronuclear) [Paramecium tetraurelia]|uniref:Uncharacterized protein n=1 Tax=Paramecium tetraurelia TaxID=5888 RepID=A0C1W0_PARTE|nr:uncharacterized protein GSPATT00034254001 [Paramecium tetraurelia]CAK64777.1 unnamed protein product [Paramecium tetraurelia]|eukprot:XP_001432174.1 hypothetical protein (macronuclear) [Paramecium tetraurelia strain d4-2]